MHHLVRCLQGYQYRRHMYGRDGEEDDDGYL